jgi:hypothetical protein
VHGTAKSQEHNFEQVKDDKIQAQNLAIVGYVTVSEQHILANRTSWLSV